MIDAGEPVPFLQTEPRSSVFRRTWDALRREPLVHFALGGGLIFLAYSLCASPTPETIVVTPEISRAVIQQHAELLGRPLSAAERQAALADYVDEEVLVREAYRRGVDRSDAALRERLADKMRFLLAGEPPSPTRQQLEEFFQTDPQRFAAGSQATFDDLLPTLKQQWVAAQRNAALATSLAELRKQYRIELPREAQNN
jgi:hypothetical protein